MTYKYILSSDLDGTLLNKDAHLSPENHRAISELARRGYCFVVNTGRTISETPTELLEHPDIRYYICSDGAVMWDKQTGVFTEIAMSREEFAPLFDLLRSYDTVDVLCSGRLSYTDIEKYTPEIYKKYRVSAAYKAFIDRCVTKIDSYESFVRSLNSVELVCSFFKSDEDMNECIKRIEQMGDFVVASSEPTNIEIYHKNAGKGNALLRLAEMLGIPQENTIAVGDSKNDLDMLGKAGLSLAMANACDELKAVADKVICSRDEHSALYILSMLS